MIWSSANGFQPFAWVPWGVYIGLPPRGTMVIRLGAGPSVSVYARRLLRQLLGPADWWIPPAAGLLVDRQAPLSRALSVAGHCCLKPGDEGFTEVSVATVPPPGGRSL